MNKPVQKRDPTGRPDFVLFTDDGLVKAHNDMAKELRERYGFQRFDRKSFKNRTMAVASCCSLWEHLESIRNYQGTTADEEGETVMTEATETETVPATAAPSKKAVSAKPAKAGKGAGKPAKAAAVKAAPKKAAAEGEAKRGRQALYSDSAKLKALEKKNPSREGSKAYDFYEMIKSSKTFGEYRKAGGNLKYLYWFVERGQAEIS